MSYFIKSWNVILSDIIVKRSQQQLD